MSSEFSHGCFPSQAVTPGEDGGHRPLDVLFINTSQREDEPAYPFLFVQLSARARMAGLSTARIEVSHLTAPERERLLRTEIARHQPRFVMVTLRQTDDVLSQTDAEPKDQKPYPILQRTRNTVALVRKLSRARILVAGRGFEQNPVALTHWLAVDYGINGDSKPVFAALAAGSFCRAPGTVPNLVYRKGREVEINRQVYLPPAREPEYDEPLIDEIIDHYDRLFRADGHQAHYLKRARPSALGIDSRQRGRLSNETPFPVIPIEIARGCPHHCRSCSEPQLAGTRVRQRNTAVVEHELRAWIKRGFRHFWLVCGEFNTLTPAYQTELLTLIQRLNSELDGHPIHWQTFQLPQTTTLPPLAALYDSGFISSSVECPTLDPTLYAQTKAPFSRDETVHFLKQDAEMRGLHRIETRLPLVWQMYETGITPSSLRQSLALAQEMDSHVSGLILLKAARLFPNVGLCRGLANRPSFRPEPGPFDPAADPLPSDCQPIYMSSPELRADFGFGERLDHFLAFLTTIASNRALQSPDWARFLRRHFRPEDLQHAWLQLVEQPMSKALAHWLQNLNDSDQQFWRQMWREPRWHLFAVAHDPAGAPSLADEHLAEQLAHILMLGRGTWAEQIAVFLDLPHPGVLWQPNQRLLLVERIQEHTGGHLWSTLANRLQVNPASTARDHGARYIVEWLTTHLRLCSDGTWCTWLSAEQAPRHQTTTLSPLRI